MAQILANSILYASEIAVVAIGISLAYSLLRFANFAHIQFAVVGGYLTYVFAVLGGLPIVLASLASMLLTGALAIATDALAFRHLRAASPASKMIASWGIALLLRSVIAAIFGGSARVFEVNTIPVRLAGARFTSLDVLVVAVTAAVMVALHILLHRTRVGTALRALASNFELAETRGIPSERMIRLMWFLSGAYAALGGTLLAVETHLRPDMDLMLMLPVFAAATIGGLGNVFGAVGGAVVLSLSQNVLISVDLGSPLLGAPWYLPTRFRDYIAVAALVLVLLLRPHGLAGRRLAQR